MALPQTDFVATIPTAPIKKQVVGLSLREVEKTEEPLFTLINEIPEDFLMEEVGFDRTIGETFFTGDLATLWSNPRMRRALMKHPNALSKIKQAASRRNIEIKPVKVSEALHCLGITQDYLWEEGIETIEELLHSFSKTNDEVIRQDISSAFLSRYGINLLSNAS